MTIDTHDAPQLKKTLAALVSILLLAAAGAVHSEAGSNELRVACQSNHCGG
jgi:hypothetical protein